MAANSIDVDWLRERIHAGDSVHQLTGEAGVSKRKIRDAMRENGIPNPTEVRRLRFDVDAVLDAYRRGESIKAIADRHQVGTTWVKNRVIEHGVTRDVPRTRPPQPSRQYAQLKDRDWLQAQLDAGLSQYRIAKLVGCGNDSVRRAIERLGVDRPLPVNDPVRVAERARHPAARFRLALTAEAKALATAERARQAQGQAIADMRADGQHDTAIGRAIGISAAKVRSLVRKQLVVPSSSRRL